MSLRFVHRCCEIFFRHFWLNLLPLALMLVAAAIFLLQPVYVSRATIFVQNATLLDTLTDIRIRDQPLTGSRALTPAQVAANELTELVQTDAFVSAVISESDLRGQLSGSAREVRQVMQRYRESFVLDENGDSLVSFHIEADDPAIAYQWARTTVKAFRLWKISRDVQDGEVASAFFQEILTPYQEDVDRANEALRSYLEQNPEPVVGQRPVDEELEIQRLQEAITFAEDRLRNVLTKQESAQLALAQTQRDVDQTYKVVDEPAQPAVAEPFWYKAPLALVFPTVGLLLVVGLVLGRTALDQTFLVRRDVAEELELPLLVTVERRSSSRKRPGKRSSAASRADEAAPQPARA